MESAWNDLGGSNQVLTLHIVDIFGGIDIYVLLESSFQNYSTLVKHSFRNFLLELIYNVLESNF